MTMTENEPSAVNQRGLAAFELAELAGDKWPATARPVRFKRRRVG